MTLRANCWAALWPTSEYREQDLDAVSYVVFSLNSSKTQIYFDTCMHTEAPGQIMKVGDRLNGIRISYIIESFGPGNTPIGGAGNLLKVIAFESMKHGAYPEVIVDSYKDSTFPNSRWERDGLKIRSFPLLRCIPQGTFLFGKTRYRQLIAKMRFAQIRKLFSPHIIHLHIHPNGLLRFAQKLKQESDAKIVVTTHGLDALVQKYKRVEQVQLYPNWSLAIDSVDCWVPCGPLDHSGLIAWGIPECKIIPIYNGIQVPETLMGQELGTKSKELVRIVYVGRVILKKGVLNLVEAVSYLSKQLDRQRFQLRFVGACAPEIRKRLENQIASRDGRFECKFIGNVPEDRVKEYLQDADIFCSPSNCPEGLPLSPLEAAAHGCPMVVSDIPAHQSVFQPNVHAVFHKAGDSKDLATAINSLIRDDGLRSRLRYNAHQLVKGAHCRRKMLAKYMSLYQDLLKDA